MFGLWGGEVFRKPELWPSYFVVRVLWEEGATCAPDFYFFLNGGVQR